MPQFPAKTRTQAGGRALEAERDRATARNGDRNRRTRHISRQQHQMKTQPTKRTERPSDVRESEGATAKTQATDRTYSTTKANPYDARTASDHNMRRSTVTQRATRSRLMHARPPV
eukprot:6350027-Prymnesium_polylepis.1